MLHIVDVAVYGQINKLYPVVHKRLIARLREVNVDSGRYAKGIGIEVPYHYLPLDGLVGHKRDVRTGSEITVSLTIDGCYDICVASPDFVCVA